jgi:hypothetical protein
VCPFLDTFFAFLVDKFSFHLRVEYFVFYFMCITIVCPFSFLQTEIANVNNMQWC